MEVKNILFVAPFAEDFNELYNVKETDRYEYDINGNQVKKFSFFMPMGAVALSTWIGNIMPQVKCSIVDCNNFIYKRIKEGTFQKKDTFDTIINNYFSSWKNSNDEPDIIGITLNTTTEYNNFFIIISCLRELFPNSVIISGGVTASYVYSDIFLKSECIDAVCVGEGEIPFKILLESHESYTEVFNNCSAFATKHKPIDKIQAIRVEDLNILPPYDFSLLSDIDLYFDYIYSNHISSYKKIYDIYLATSRGCVFNCYFCNTKSICGKGIRYFSDEWVFNTIDNICIQLQHTKFNCITFTDELLFLKFERAKKYFEYCKNKGIFSFPGNSSFITSSQEVIDLIKEMSPGYVSLPLESGSQRVLKSIIKKPIDINKVPTIIKNYREAGIIVRLGVMIGLPGETKNDIREEIEYYKTLEIDWLGISFATPFPGSDLYEDCIKNNYLACKSIGDIRLKKAVIQTEDFSTEYLEDILYFINLEVNFKYNYNIRAGEYDRALIMFKEVLNVVPEHAFAFYYMAKCYRELGQLDKSDEYIAKYNQLISKNEFWRSWSTRMNLETKGACTYD